MKKKRPSHYVRRTLKPFRVSLEAIERDPRVPDAVWTLPDRVQAANNAGPKYSQTELADNSGVAKAVISKLTRKTNLVALQLGTIFKLSTCLNVSVCWLLGGNSNLPLPVPVTVTVSEASRRRSKAATKGKTAKGKRRNSR